MEGYKSEKQPVTAQETLDVAKSLFEKGDFNASETMLTKAMNLIEEKDPSDPAADAMEDLSEACNELQNKIDEAREKGTQ